MTVSEKWCVRATQLLIVTTMIISWWSMREHYNGPPEWLEYPQLSAAEVERRVDALYASLHDPKSPEGHALALHESMTLEQAIRRGFRETRDNGDINTFMRMSQKLQLFGSAGTITNVYQDKFGYRAVAEATQHYTKTHPGPLRHNAAARIEESGVQWRNAKLFYLLSIPAAFMFFLLRILQEEELSLRLELLCFWRPLYAAVFWPFMVFCYPNGTIYDQTKRAMFAIRYALSATISVCGFGAMKVMAQDTEAPEPKNGRAVAAQIDIRMRDTVGVQGQMQQFVRFTLLPKRWVTDIISIRTGKTFNGRYAAGPEVLNRWGFRIFAAGSVSPSSSGITSVGEGAQVYWGRPPTKRLPKIEFAMPVAEAFHEFGNGRTTHGLKENHQLLVYLHPRVAVGEETFVAKPFGQAASGYHGPTFGLWPDTHKKLMLEAGALRAFTGDWMFRARLVFNFKIAFGH